MKTKWRVFVFTTFCVLAVACLVQACEAQDSAGTVVSVAPAQNTAQQSQTLTLNITVSTVQNLYGLDVTLNWNKTVLQIENATTQLGVESHPRGVLHEAPEAPIIVAEDSFSQETGEYHLVATSQGTAAAFNGSGTIATLTFTVINAGYSELALTSELADHPLPGETTSELIAHSDIGGSVEAAIPEFPQTALLAALIALVTMALVFSKRLPKKKS
ncbi:MAG: cohesin domain-containing protein [Candidatus Bathyarchaeota archaeon]|nr:cohesin domain-containing protein [Candidatus Bathyarchaeota archaeon]